MIRYRTWFILGGVWHIGDTYSQWPDVQMAMALAQRQNHKIICVVRDGRIDRHLAEHGRLPPDVRSQLARVGQRIFAERCALGGNLTERRINGNP